MGMFTPVVWIYDFFCTCDRLHVPQSPVTRARIVRSVAGSFAKSPGSGYPIICGISQMIASTRRREVMNTRVKTNLQRAFIIEKTI